MANLHDLAELPLAHVIQRFGVAGQSFVDDTGAQVRTADRGFPGTATIGGAEDGRTVWHARGFKEGRVAKRERLRGHGLKRPAVAPGTEVVLHGRIRVGEATGDLELSMPPFTARAFVPTGTAFFTCWMMTARASSNVGATRTCCMICRRVTSMERTS